MNWYKLATEEEVEFKIPNEKEDTYHLDEVYNSEEIGMLGIRGKAQERFLETMPGTKNWLIRWKDDEGKIKANNVLSDDRVGAIRIFGENIGKEIIDIILVSMEMERIPEAKNHYNGPLDAYELKQLAYIGITPEQIERSKSMTKRPNSNWRAYIEQYFGQQRQHRN